MGRAGRGDDVGILHRKLALSCLRGLPQLVIDDAKLGNFGRDPFVAWIEARDAPAGRRVLDVAEPVPDQLADVEFVVDEAGAARGVTAQGGVRPQRAIGAGNAFLIQAPGDRARAYAGGEGAEDAADDLGLRLVDGALAADRLTLRVGVLHHVIAVAETTAGLALFDPTADAAMRLGGKVLQEQRVHRAFEADMKLADLAFAQRDDLHTSEAQMLEQRRHVGLVTAHAVQSLGQHDLEPAALRILQQRLDAGTKDYAGAGDGGVVVGADHLPRLARGVLAADTKLVVDRGDALVVGGIAGIERNLGHRIVSWAISPRTAPAAHCRSRPSAARMPRVPSAGRSGGRSSAPPRRSEPMYLHCPCRSLPAAVRRRPRDPRPRSSPPSSRKIPVERQTWA